MTVITVTSPKGRLSVAQRRALALQLTDAVLEPELGQPFPAARIGFQVHFRMLDVDEMAIGGRLVADAPADIMTVDIAVMDAAWPPATRRAVIENTLGALAKVCGLPAPSPTWWVQFRVIAEGCWGSRGGVLSIRDLLGAGAFSDVRIAEIEADFQQRPRD